MAQMSEIEKLFADLDRLKIRFAHGFYSLNASILQCLFGAFSSLKNTSLQ